MKTIAAMSKKLSKVLKDITYGGQPTDAVEELSFISQQEFDTRTKEPHITESATKGKPNPSVALNFPKQKTTRNDKAAVEELKGNDSKPYTQPIEEEVK